ncbi:hypothetical protein Tco_0876998 [Tanacetum coccineum]|uniref:Uncharacterized protein n=1 Tax=Tanacetum coccineum TaxID=301880 RepID=A0ABQ5BWI8_9ASTR
MIDYALWEVIENGATLPKTTTVEGVVTVMPITTAEEKAQRRLEVKARSTLMMGIPNEHQLKFNSIKDAKKLLEACLNENLMLDGTFDRIHKLNKADLDTMSMDDHYNNSRCDEPKKLKEFVLAQVQEHITWLLCPPHRVSTASTQVNAANFTNIDNMSDAIICAFFASQPNSPQLIHEDLQQIHPDDMEEMD